MRDEAVGPALMTTMRFGWVICMARRANTKERPAGITAAAATTTTTTATTTTNATTY